MLFLCSKDHCEESVPGNEYMIAIRENMNHSIFPICTMEFWKCDIPSGFHDISVTFLVKYIKDPSVVCGKSMKSLLKIHGSYGFSMDPGFPFFHVPSMLIHIQGSAFRLRCLTDTYGVSEVSDVSGVSDVYQVS